MTKVAVLHHYGGLGGAGLMLYNLTEELIHAGHEVHILVPEGRLAEFIKTDFPSVDVRHISSLNDLPHYAGGSYFAFHPRFILRFLRSTRSHPEFEEYIREIEPMYLIVNSSVLIPYLQKVRQIIPRIKTVLIIQENIASGLFGLRKYYLRRLTESYSSLTLFISEFDQRHFHVSSQQGIMRNWISRKSVSSEREDDEVGKVGMLYMGGLSRLKGLHVLLRAVRLLRVRGINEPLTILGEMQNTSRNPLERRLFDHLLRSTPRIQVRGSIKEPTAFIAASSVVVFPITKPHQGRPIMEAGYHFKPVVATNFEALREDLIHNYNGLMFRNGKVTELADALEHMLTDTDRLQLMGHANRSMYESLHTRKNADILLNYLSNGELK